MFTILILLLIFNTQPCITAYCANQFYARVMYEDVKLYKTPVEIENFNNIYFSLPRTYFVEILDDTNSTFYHVKYSSLEGYVKKDSVQIVSGTPQKPFLTDLNFRIYAEPSRDLRSEPSTKNGSVSQIKYIPLYSRNITYLGEIKGEELVEGRTDIWYFCRYSAENDYYGYVYSEFCDELPQIPLNTEEMSYLPRSTLEEKEIPTSLPLKNKTTAMVILILTLPAVAFILLSLKNTKFFSHEQKQKNEIKEYLE